jgi:hypothetical protein
LLAEVPPIERTPTPPPIVTTPNATALDASAQIDAEDEEEEEEDDVDSDAVSDDDYLKGKGKGFFSKGFGKGKYRDDNISSDDDDDDDDAYFPGKGKAFPGGRSAMRGGGQGKGHRFPEGGGQVLGSADGSAAQTGGAALVYSSSSSSAATSATTEEQRAARLAALERRGMAPAQVATSKSTLPTPGQERTVKGQMGDGCNKEERAREREAILQRLKEDREWAAERKAPAIVPTTNVADQDKVDGVRLQIRCPVSRRVHMTNAFSPGSLLASVRDAAAAALSIKDPILSLAYPPWTEFTPEQYDRKLGDLQLCPSSMLHIKSASAAPADGNVAAADDSNVATLDGGAEQSAGN